jgi:hypothetical protein
MPDLLKYDDSDWTEEEMIALAAQAFDDADNAGPIPEEPISSEVNDDDRKRVSPNREEGKTGGGVGGRGLEPRWPLPRHASIPPRSAPPAVSVRGSPLAPQ